MAIKTENTNAGAAIISAPSPSVFLAEWLKNSEILPEAERRTFEGYYRNFGTLGSPRMRWAYDRQLDEVTKLVRSRPGLELFEVGAGCGTEALWFALVGADVTSIDIKTDRLNTARARQKLMERYMGGELNCRFQQQNLLETEGENRFDLIWAEQAFHHLEPRAECVAAITRLLRPGGYVVISEVNAWNPLIQLQLFMRRGFQTLSHFEDEDGNLVPYGNERILTARRLNRWFRDAGLGQSETNYYRVLPSNAAFDRFTAFERLISGSALMPLNTHYNFVARKPV